MILPSGGVEFLVVNAHPPASDSLLRNQFIVLILDDCHPSFLGYSLNWTDPITVLYRVDDPSVE